MDHERTVGEVAEFLGVTVRTLHHWDKVGLLQPSAHSWSGYRLYAPADLARAQRVLVFREAGVPLAQISTLLDAVTDQHEHLVQQRELLQDRLRRVQRMLQAVDDLIIEAEGTRTMSNEQAVSTERIQEILGTDWDPSYQQEAEEKWGDTPEWAVAQQVQDAMTEQDWRDLRAELDGFNQALAEAKGRGVQPGSEEGNQLAERHRAQITRWYECSHQRHAAISGLYREDSRWEATYTVEGKVLNDYLVELIRANAEHHGVDLANISW